MKIVEENGLRILVAAKGKVLQSVTDGAFVGSRLILGIKDSEKHYIEKDEVVDDELSS